MGQDLARREWVLTGVLGAVTLVEGEVLDSGPDLGVGSAHRLKDLQELVVVVVAGEKGFFVNDLGEDAADRPNVDRGGAILAAHENVRGPAPEGDYLVGKVLHGDSEGTCQPEIGQLEDSLPVDEEVLGLQVPVQHLVLMALLNAVQQLEQEAFNLRRVYWAWSSIQQLFQVLVEVCAVLREIHVTCHTCIETAWWLDDDTNCKMMGTFVERWHQMMWCIAKLSFAMTWILILVSFFVSALFTS